MQSVLADRGVQAALGSAALFGAGTPAAKLLLCSGVSAWLLAGRLYTGSGVGLTLIRVLRRAPRVHLQPHDLPALIGAVVLGGIGGPALLLAGTCPPPARRCS